MTFEQEIEALAKSLQGYGKLIASEQQRVAALGGAYMASSVSAKTPRGTKIHKRYSTPKVNKRLKAPKGMGRVVATYYPGNLQSSIQVLKFRRAKTKVFVGGKLAKGQAAGNFGKGVRVDGYYLHMVEKGTKKQPGRNFMEGAVRAATPTTQKIMIGELLRIHEKYKIQNGL